MNDNNKFLYIWRNKIIKNKILSFLRDDKNFYSSYRYNRIFSCSWMIENGYFELLKEKVEKGEYLVFINKNIFDNGVLPLGLPRSLTKKKYDNNINNNNNNDNKNKNNKNNNNNNNIKNNQIIFDSNSIFYKEKAAIHWDLNFYNNLFKNYSNYFLNFNKSITESTLIEYDNQQALQVLVENFNHILGIESFFKSFEIGSYECSFYIFNKFKNEILKSKKHQTRIWNIILNYSNMKNELITSEILNQRIDFIINKCQIPPTTTTTDLESFVPFLFEIKIFKQKLSTIIDCVKSIIQLNELFTPFITSINDKSYKLKLPKNQEIICSPAPPQSKIDKEFKMLNKLISQLGSSGKQDKDQDKDKNKNNKFKLPIDIKEFESLIFTNFNNDNNNNNNNNNNNQQQQQLNTIICDFNQNNTTNEQFQLIKKLYLLLLPFTNHFNCFIDNWNFYKINYENDYQDYQTFKKNDNFIVKGTIRFHSKMFAHYNFNDLNNECIDDNKLFEYCKNEKQLQINYLNNLNNDLKNNQSNNNNNNSILKCILINLIWLDDMELIKNLNIPDDIEFSQINITMFISKVKSIEMFDFIIQIIKKSELKLELNKSQQQQVSKISIVLQRLIYSYKPITILEHYKNKYSSDYYSSVSSIDLRDKCYSFEIFKFVYDNLSDFKDLEKVCTWQNNINFAPTLNQIKYLVERTPQNEKYSLPFNCNVYKPFFEYVVEERFQDIQNKTFVPENGKTMLFWYFIFNKEFRNNNNNNEKHDGDSGDDEIILKYKLNLMNFFDEKFERDPSIIRETLSKACSLNDLHFIDLIMEKAKSSNLKYRYYNIYSNCLMEVLSSIGDLEILKYIHSKYPDLVEQNFKSIGQKQDQVGFFFCCPSIRLSILNGNIDILSFILNLYPEKLSITSSRLYLSFNNSQLLNHFLNLKLFEID
ncbi:hypothetical protein DDB_G0289683 [Dictyostelium discoideum AX4]|uniref:Uncharacterized protein n=1 Tax=Dictyostelium discoideum TaxID=44689 RepID=Q54H64_DICDI|nr:hypothetical protein DDB_G0289683 [Dictyostelium discoideum AX4]EAL62553.1 hypothetical protein DDB_G0289683 [Dictyostelium discoideum AX4]|eukprot:XP_636054.1 hypothetical protein DDB_G0289683 [Dictyostelium discoideum AX4]